MTINLASPLEPHCISINVIKCGVFLCQEPQSASDKGEEEEQEEEEKR